MRLFFILLLFVFTTSGILFGQVVNIEGERIKGKDEGWNGDVKAGFAIRKNNSLLYDLNINTHLQYKNQRSIWLLLGQAGWIKVEGAEFSNLAFGHFRYNYVQNNWLQWEAFTQGQFNRIAKINFRGLAGLGPRFKLLGAEAYRVYLGTLVMYEHEEPIGEKINRDFRFSTYLSLTIVPNDNFKIVSTTYYQPRLDKLNDYRISSESTFQIKISERLAFDSSYRIFHDSFAVVGAPATIYSWTNGLKLKF